MAQREDVQDSRRILGQLRDAIYDVCSTAMRSRNRMVREYAEETAEVMQGFDNLLAG